MNTAALLADLVMITHVGFVVFVATGALIGRRRAWLRRLHMAALTYAVAVSTFHWRCPLTSLEDHLRLRAGQSVDARSFVARLAEPLLYPNLSPRATLAGAIFVFVVSLMIYAYPTRRDPDR